MVVVKETVSTGWGERESQLWAAQGWRWQVAGGQSKHDLVM